VTSFEDFGADLAAGLAEPPQTCDVDLAILETEVKLGCTTAMLLCLDREHRLAFVLGTVFDLAGADAAGICGVEPATYRKRLSRARERIRIFMSGACGLVNPEATCRCARRVRPALATGRVDPRRLLFAPAAAISLRPAVEQMERLHATAEIFRCHPRYTTPDRVVEAVQAALASGRYPLLTDG
jgi:hypothetical protein